MPRPIPNSTQRLVPGTRIRVIANSNEHNYTIGQTYIVNGEPNSKGQFRARDEADGRIGNLLLAEDVEAIHAIGWGWLATVLPAVDVALLSAFDGLSKLTLKPEVKDAILAQLGDLEVAITRSAAPPSREQGP